MELLSDLSRDDLGGGQVGATLTARLTRLDTPEVNEFVEPFGWEEVLGGRRVVAHELVELLVELVLGEPEVFVEGSIESEGPNIFVKA
ncbi:MAG: hypothetical protein VX568_02855, partial [Actinomycetota bacterium]|nr:hypothetical protein [Actinomycetota bacterium]